MESIAEVRQSKKTVTAILIITAVLAITSVITGYFYFQIKDVSPKDSSATEGCACYFVASTDAVQSCGNANPKMAYEFRTGDFSQGGVCSANCDLKTTFPLVNESSELLSCKLDKFTINPGCVDISVEDSNEKRYSNSVPIDTTLNIKAKFTTPSNSPDATKDFYSNFSFLINGEKTDIQLDQATATGEGLKKEYMITTQLKNYSQADSLTIQALGKSTTGSEITSEACHRVLTVNKPQSATCTLLNAEIINESNGTPKVNEITINTAAISSPNSLSIKFTLGNQAKTLTTKNIASVISNNALILDKAYLYKASNFVDGESFSILDNETSRMKIVAQMYVNGESISSDGCSGEFDIPVLTDEERSLTEDEENTQNDVQTDENNQEEEATDKEVTGEETSDFSVSKASSTTCVERVSPSNTLKYTITVTNNDVDTENIVRIEDKLPLGFTYTAGTTYINGALIADEGFITVSTVGSSQQITFDPESDWTLDSGEALTLRFSSKVGSTALTGSNLNEVVVVPVNTPKSSTSVRTSKSVTVAQSCTSPETGLFDSTVSKVVLSIFIIFLGTFLYFSQSGILLSEKLLTSGPAQTLRFWKMKKENPNKYFEEKSIRNIEKERR